MIYTVGNREAYERGFDEHKANGKKFAKKGMGQVDGKLYLGGAVWLERVDAEAFVAKYPEDGLAVYGVEADWEKDTMDYGEEFRRLLVDRPLVQL